MDRMENVFLHSSSWSNGGIKSEAIAEISEDGKLMSVVKPYCGGDSESSEGFVIQTSSPKSIKARIISEKKLYARASMLRNGVWEVRATEKDDDDFNEDKFYNIKNRNIPFVRRSFCISNGVESCEPSVDIIEDGVSASIKPYIGEPLTPRANVSQTFKISNRKQMGTATIYADGSRELVLDDCDKENQVHF